MKRILIILAMAVIIAGGWYAYGLYTGKVKRLTEVQAEVRISAAELINAFEKDSAAAHKQYLGKIIAVTGNVKEVETESATVVLGKEGSLSSVRCSMDSGFVKEISALNPGSQITIKGNCTGYNPDELGLGADVVLNRCVLVSNKQ